jgi:prepilin-type N-terminal cleavage/methylation domain-containing protein/prepilin-type processing-associated H-X9-DG protein
MRRKEMKRKIYNGFTLIELLVVVSIIALLVSILMPALAKAREQAKKVVCSSAIHGMGNTFTQYAVDYKDKLMLPFTRVPRQGNLRQLAEQFPYDFSYQHIPPEYPSDGINPSIQWLRKDIHDLLEKTYQVTDETWVCPSMQKQKYMYAGVWPEKQLFLGENNKLYWNENWSWNDRYNDYWAKGYYHVGYALLTNLYRIRSPAFPHPLSGPPHVDYNYVKESPKTINEKGDKHVMADLNALFQGNTPGLPAKILWSHRYASKAAHRNKRDSAPDGGNRCYLDGHVEWIPRYRMGFEDNPDHAPDLVPEASGKYDYATTLGRDAFW